MTALTRSSGYMSCKQVRSRLSVLLSMLVIVIALFISGLHVSDAFANGQGGDDPPPSDPGTSDPDPGAGDSPCTTGQDCSDPGTSNPGNSSNPSTNGKPAINDLADAACSRTDISNSISGASVTGSPVDSVCYLMVVLGETLNGTTGIAIATLAVMILGLCALLGKISWVQAMVVVTGVALIFGSSSIMAILETTQASGSGTDPISKVLANITNEMSGPAGEAIGSVVVIIIGIGALLGKVSWQQAMALITGVAMVYGALGIVQNLQPESSVTWTPQSTDAVGLAFQNIIAAMTGELGVSIATAAVMALGFVAMLGKLAWPKALLLAIGIALMFGAADVVGILTNSLTPCSTTSTDPFTQVICGFMDELQGPMGKTIATLAVMIVGILAMLGKVSWEFGFIVAVGLALVFGANSIVELMETNTSISGLNCGSAPPTPPSTGNAIGDLLCYIIMILYGPAGKALATVAVIMMGFGALMGKVSYSQAFVVAVGIAVTFGAQPIAGILLPSATTTGCTLTSGTASSSC